MRAWPVLAVLCAGCAASGGSRLREPLIHQGMCDASAGVALAGQRIIVGNDEDNALRIYASGRSGPPLARIPLDRFLEVDPKEPETDIEGAARVGDRIYWITSHGRNKNGKLRESRMRFFATTVGSESSRQVEPVGRPYRSLLNDLLADASLRGLGLDAASARAPKAKGGLNIEGLGATPDGHLLIGFRSPVPDGKALAVPLLNPSELVDGNGPARFGTPVRLDLGGLGIRDLAWAAGSSWILAGPPGEGGTVRLYRWKGGGGLPEPLPVDLRQLTPEALVADPEDPSGVRVLSDDGTVSIGGTPCKRLPESRRRFRSIRVELPPP